MGVGVLDGVGVGLAVGVGVGDEPGVAEEDGAAGDDEGSSPPIESIRLWSISGVRQSGVVVGVSSWGSDFLLVLKNTVPVPDLAALR